MKGTEPESDTGVSSNVPISQLEVSKGGVISSLSTENSDLIRRLISMGFVPGRKVSLKSIVSDKGARIVTVGDSTIAIDLEMSSAVLVKVLG